ncbi:MAG: phosphatase, partial [bacterium]
KILEINNNSYRVRMGSYENCLEIARLVAREGVMIAINSDSHFAYDVGESDWALSIIKDAGVPEELVLTAKAERVKEYLKQRGKRLGEHTTAVV